MQNNDLPVAQVRGTAFRHIHMRRGRYHHHDHLGFGQGLLDVTGHQGQLAKPVRPAIITLQVNPPALMDDLDVFEGAVVERHLEAHQGQVGCHGFAAMPGSDYGVIFYCGHTASLWGIHR